MDNRPVRLFVDDIRPLPLGLNNREWMIATNYNEAIRILQEYNVIEISLDHDLGEEKTGYDIAKWLTSNDKWPGIVNFHSANPVGVANMENEYKFYLKYKENK